MWRTWFAAITDAALSPATINRCYFLCDPPPRSGGRTSTEGWPKPWDGDPPDFPSFYPTPCSTRLRGLSGSHPKPPGPRAPLEPPQGAPQPPPLLGGLAPGRHGRLRVLPQNRPAPRPGRHRAVEPQTGTAVVPHLSITKKRTSNGRFVFCLSMALLLRPKLTLGKEDLPASAFSLGTPPWQGGEKCGRALRQAQGERSF